LGTGVGRGVDNGFLSVEHSGGAAYEKKGEILMRRLRDALLGAALVFSAAGACAQGFPSKPVRIVVPFPPGGGADTLARIMEPRLAAIWAQAIVVENRPGASGHIGADLVAKSAPDGHTLLMSSTASLTEKNVDQFAPVSLVSASPYVVTANPKVAAADIRGLIALAKASPGKLSFGSSGTGAASHLSAELFKSMAGVDLLHVPYKGTGQALTDLLAGHVNLMFAPAQTVMPHVQSGKLKALGVTGARRSQTLPDLPTVAESGLPGYEAVGWFGLLAPAATPKATVAKLSVDANRVLAMRDVREKMLGLGAEPAGNTPEEFASFIRGDQAKWSRLMKEAGITPE
jgi:tripartite-type tricarboxylate transporter receptor subunit TctC